MGSWNETCAITRLPIHSGEEVVCLTTVQGPEYQNKGTFKTSLLFGLPLHGRYDDYGGVEELAQPKQEAFLAEAFLKSGFYREVEGITASGSVAHALVASSAETLWSLPHTAKVLFYDEADAPEGDLLSGASSAQDALLNAYKRADAALAATGKELGQIDFGRGQVIDAKILEVLAKHFGEHRKWAAYQLLRKSGLFAGKSLIFMHKAAYFSLVEEMGKRKVSSNKGMRVTLREFLKAQLDKWKVSFEEETQGNRAAVAKLEEALANEPGNDELRNLVEEERRYREKNMRSKCSYLAPLALPWLGPDAPLIGHFWGGASLSEIEAHYTEKEVLDYFVFQWARNWLRVDLMPSSGGSQNDETDVLSKAFKATLAELKKNGRTGSDFDPYISD